MNSLIFLSFYLFWTTVILFTPESKKAGTELPEYPACFDLDSSNRNIFQVWWDWKSPKIWELKSHEGLSLTLCAILLNQAVRGL